MPSIPELIQGVRIRYHRLTVDAIDLLLVAFVIVCWFLYQFT